MLIPFGYQYTMNSQHPASRTLLPLTGLSTRIVRKGACAPKGGRRAVPRHLSWLLYHIVLLTLAKVKDEGSGSYSRGLD